MDKETKYEFLLTKIKDFEIIRNNLDWMITNYDQWENKKESLHNLYDKFNFVEIECCSANCLGIERSRYLTLKGN